MSIHNGGPTVDPAVPPVLSSERKAASIEALGFTGIVFAVLSSAAVALLSDLPGWKADDTTITRWLADDAQRMKVIVASYLALFASIALLWFMATLRRRVGILEDRLFATVFLGSGLLFIAFYLAGFAALLAPVLLAERGGAGSIPASAFQMMHSLGSVFLAVVSTRMAALLMLSLSNLGRITNAFPRWLTLAGTVAGLVVLISAGFTTVMVWVFPAWALIVGIEILCKRKKLDR